MPSKRRVPALAMFGSLTAAVVALVLLASGGPAGADGEGSAKRAPGQVITQGLDIPWGLDFLPNGAAIVAQRSRGTISRIPKGGGRAKKLMDVPNVDKNAGEGGLLGLAVSPRYRRTNHVFAYLTTGSDNRIVRFELGRPGTTKVLVKGLERSTIHNGGRIAFGPDGKLYATVGDAGQPNLAQRRGSRNGKILRLNPDGSTPKSNPWNSKVWSIGHRNPQGLAWDSKGRLWAPELGQNTFDEVNLIRKGRNYGWPVREGRGATNDGKYTNPKVTWSPAEASPSGAAIRGKTLFVGALRGERLWRVPLNGKNAGTPKAKLRGAYGRLRTVERAPGGALWITTSNGGGSDRIIRLARR